VYNNCLHGFAKRGMMDEAETLLAIMEHNYTRHFKIPTSLTTTTSTALDFNTTTSPTPTQDTSSSLSSIHYTHFQYLQQLKTSMIFPDTVSYTTCLDACAKAKKTLPSRLDSRLVIIPKETRAQRILSRMLELYESTQDIRFRPTHATFGTIIGLYAKWNDATAPILAHGFLQTLIQLSEREKTSLPVSKTKKFYSLQPNAFMFSTVMSTYNRQKIKDADERVAKLLGQMEQLYEAGNELCKPTFQVQKKE
jgi:pentatricopeptide repeat protein